MKKDFIVVDTEGNPELTEIAIFDSEGNLIYEAFVKEHRRKINIAVNLRPLEEIIKKFAELAESKDIVCHQATHDFKVLRNGMRKVGISYESLSFICTYELAKNLITTCPSFSLQSLSRHLNLKVNGKLFNGAQAHTARYDAEFTYQLYQKILQLKQIRTMNGQLNQIPNPFSSSRVDNPFQDHLDIKQIYHFDFERLKSVLHDIKNDSNQQSKGAVVIGEAGSGKTHLMMRIAKELLTTNRLLFIRQPNNHESVLYHIYARILESFAEKVGDKNHIINNYSHTQLELLLARSFVKILSSLDKVTKTQKGQEIIRQLQNDVLSLYRRLDQDGTQKNLDKWQFIERNIAEWWSNRYTAAGYSANILKGIIKFCSYTDPHKKELVRRWLAANELEPEEAQSIGLENWRDEMSREEFALEAIAVFGKLSTLDEPLIIVFDQLEGLGLSQNLKILASFGEAIKEILTHVPHSLIILNLFPDRWQQFQDFFDSSVVERISQHKIVLKIPSRENIQKILDYKIAKEGLTLAHLFTGLELDDILSQKSIRGVLSRAFDYFEFKSRNIPLPSGQNIPEQKLIADTISPNMEDRISQLENIIKQISALISPYIMPNAYTETTQPDPNTQTPSPPIKIQIDDKIKTYILEQRKFLEQKYTRPTIINDDGEIGKLNKIVEAFSIFQNITTDQLRYGKTKLPDNLLIQIATQKYGIGFLNSSGNTFTSKIKNFNQLVITEPNIKFRLIRDAREPQINPKTVGEMEIEKLNNTQNGTFAIMDKEDRINFELIHNLITDIQEKDLDIELNVGLKALKAKLKDYWLISLLT